MIALVSAGWGCVAAVPTSDVWIVEQPGRCDRRAADAPSSSAARSVNLLASINETVGFLFAVRPGACPIDFPELRVTPFRASGARIDPSTVELFRVHPVAVGPPPGWHVRSIPPSRRDAAPLDVLVPLAAPRGGLPRRLEPGATYHFWADVRVAKGTAAGVYSSSVELFAGDQSIASLPMQLTVVPLVLPDDSAIEAVAEVDHVGLFRHHLRSTGAASPAGVVDWFDSPRRAQYEALLSSTLRLLRGHRLTPVLPDLNPPIRVSTRGELSIDWRGYDAVVGPLLDGSAFFDRIPLGAWPMPVGQVFVGRAADARTRTEASERLLRDHVAQCAAHFAERGWLDRAYALSPFDRPGRAESAESTRRFAAIVRSVDPRIAVATRLFPQDASLFGWFGYSTTSLGDDVRIWIPPARFFDPAAMAAERDAGRETWFAVDRPPFSGSLSVHAPPTHVEVLPWQAASMNSPRLWIGAVNRWPTDSAAGDPAACAAFDPDAILLPGLPFGLDEPVPTLRLKRLRGAMQSAAYADLLTRNGRGHVADLLRESLVHYAGSAAYRTHFLDGRAPGWSDDPEVFELARRIMILEMLPRVSDAPLTGANPSLERAVAWKKLFDLTRKPSIRVDGARLRPRGRPGALQAELDFWLTVANPTRRPLSVSLSLLDPPDAEVADAEPARLDSLPPGRSRIVVLSVRWNRLADALLSPDRLAVQGVADDSVTMRAKARFARVVAGPAIRPIAIDGDLSDWPPGATNVLADFRLISGRCDDDLAATIEPLDGSRPARRAFGFVLRDDANLYIAVNAETAPGLPAPAAVRRSVRYDDMIPIDGDDLVEILVDPLNGGSRSPGDLYHVVVKRSGATLFERGIECDPPCGPRTPWPADIDVATRVMPDRWTAELRIPLAAFDRGDPRGEIWGFNVTRLDAAAREFSTWSGAVGNAYDPLSLGNLVFP